MSAITKGIKIVEDNNNAVIGLCEHVAQQTGVTTADATVAANYLNNMQFGEALTTEQLMASLEDVFHRG
jgi:hypothetical protein